MEATLTLGHGSFRARLARGLPAAILGLLCCLVTPAILQPVRAESIADGDSPGSDSASNPAADTNAVAPRFNVRAYVVEGGPPVSTNVLREVFSKYTGTNLDLAEIAEAAVALQSEYVSLGQPAMSVAIPQEHITNGVVTLYVFQATVPQVLLSGVRYTGTNLIAGIVPSPAEAAAQPSIPPPTPGKAAATASATNSTSRGAAHSFVPVANPRRESASAAEVTALLAAVRRRLAEPEDTRVHVISTNAGPRFEVKNYMVVGNSLLTPATIRRAITNIDGAFGTNVSFDGIKTVASELENAYRERGYGMTVSVVVPQQKLTNATVKLQVVESRLSAIRVVGNRHFSSNNVLRALPSLHTNLVLNSQIFNAELNRANANQDRQIYPVIGPGPDPGTSDLTLNVKDRLPLHAKLELNNQNSPGTPDLRVNASAAYNNLWQTEHSLGVQYGFSPEAYKEGDQWGFYDRPQVAYYSAFYRLPLGSPQPIEDLVANNPLSFGYSEATRQFRLPQPSGQPELNLYASRSTVDTGLQTLANQVIFDLPGVRKVTRQDVQEDSTINESLGFRLSAPLKSGGGFRSVLSGGLDFKTYSLVDNKTNVFSFTEITHDANGNLNPPIISSVNSPSPMVHRSLEYLPVSLRYDLSGVNQAGPASLGLGLSVNTWYSGSTSFSSSSTNRPADLHGKANLQGLTGSGESSGYWVILNFNLSQEITLFTNWPMTFRLNSQWASEPLISTEQFGVGGVASVRGYHEGEVFGDEGVSLSLEQRTPQAILGMAYGNEPLAVSGTIYTDFGEAILIDPKTRPEHIGLLSVGAGGMLTIGPYWQARMLFSVPLLGTVYTRPYQPVFSFALDAQF